MLVRIKTNTEAHKEAGSTLSVDLSNMSIRKAAAPKDQAAAHKREEKDAKLIQQILNLLEQGWSYRALSAELSVHYTKDK